MFFTTTELASTKSLNNTKLNTKLKRIRTDRRKMSLMLVVGLLSINIVVYSRLVRKDMDVN